MIIIILPPTTHTLKTHLHHVEYEEKKRKKSSFLFWGDEGLGWGPGVRSEPTSKNGAAK